MEKEKVILPERLLAPDFEQQYIEVRKKELQYYTHEQIALLPDIEPAHPHYSEWQLRKKSCSRLIEYLKKTKRPLNILEVGCGNGWLSSKLSAIENATVTGVDINATELRQASSVFKNKSNLRFVYGDIRDRLLVGQAFDIIIFAASVPYFQSLTQILRAALHLLTPNGEIHITDSPIYEEGKAALARQRTKDYYDVLGFPGMAAYYFHHSFSELKAFRFRIMYNPFSLMNKLLNKQAPFYWICVFQLT